MEYFKMKFICRAWREVGEQPCLWSSLKLKFLAVNGEPRADPDGPIGWTQDLKEVLNMKRLQTLQQLTLDFSLTGLFINVMWKDCICFLQIISKNSPTVRKLCLETLHLAEPLPSPNVLAKKLVAKLVKFEEIDFGTEGFLFEDYCDTMSRSSITNAILRRLLAVAKSGGDFKLQVLSMPGRPQNISKTLAEARKFLTINLSLTTHRIMVDF